MKKGCKGDFMAESKLMPIGMEMYRERYIKAGRAPDKVEIRFFMAELDILIHNPQAIQLARDITAKPHDLENPKFNDFYLMALDNYRRRWKNAPVQSHQEICAKIAAYERGELSYGSD